MTEQPSHIIQQLARSWKRRRAAALIIRVIAFSLPLAATAIILLRWPWWTILCITTVVLLAMTWLRPANPISTASISSFLNRRYPELQESTQLLLQPASELNQLQRLQLQITAGKLAAIGRPRELNAGLKTALGIFTGALVVTLLLVVAFLYKRPAGPAGNTNQVIGRKKEPAPAGLRSYRITITPPAYTGLPARDEDNFSITAEEGSTVTWTLRTDGIPSRMGYLFNNGPSTPLKTSADSLEWTFNRVVNTSGFYQLEIGGKVSPLYQLEMIPDKPAVIEVLAPAQHTSFEPGQLPRLQVKAVVKDDYGIRSARLMATKASGKGEAVSFREETLDFTRKNGGNREQSLATDLDLAKMGMKAGDELYFYIKAMDNHGQESRSDMFFVSLPDTEELLSLSSLTSGVDQVPEYFRSQRQIILDTEKLLKEKSSIPQDSFRLRSNELGNDQKLLRLRYGKFLGEENESGVHSPDDGHDHGAEPPAYGDVQALMDQYAHKHDNAEDATFFEPAQKAQLKAVLEEMWKSELKLRTYLPDDALPFEYKALILLKDLQQKSRAYVSKISVRKNTLNPDKRLSGDQSKINRDPSSKNTFTWDETIAALKATLSLTARKTDGQFSSGQFTGVELHQLSLAEKSISAQAIKDPAHFLQPLSILREFRKSGTTPAPSQLRQLQSAISLILGQAEPAVMERPGAGRLADRYYQQLNKPG